MTLIADTDHHGALRPGAPAAGPAPGSGGTEAARAQAGRRPGGGRYWPALDGLRALAVAAVVLYHLAPGALPGGFFGVDLFFVISGYLITTLLAREAATTGRIRLAAFWVRRVRRLYPAMLVAVVGVVALAGLLAPSSLVAMRTDVPAALLYVTNWWFVFHHVPYFQAMGRPPLLGHFWSLAIEEQYYLIWPPVLFVALRKWRDPRRVARFTLGAAALSSVLMAVLYQPGASIDRVYYGSDTHFQGLLLGSALGLMSPPERLVPALQRASSRAVAWVGATALAGILVAMLSLSDGDGFTWRGGLALVVLLAGVAVLVAVHGRNRAARVLSSPPMRWLGARSYSVYLWYWPILELTRPHQDLPFSGPGLFVLRIALILAAAHLSWRFVEQPWRTGRAQARVRALVASGRRARQLGSALVAGVVVVVVAVLSAARAPVPPGALALGETAAARVSAPAGPLGAPPGAVGPGSVEAGAIGPGPGSSPTGVLQQVPVLSGGLTATTTTSTTVPPTTVAPTTTAAPTTAPPVTIPASGGQPGLVAAPAGGPVIAIGDSVMLAASPDLTAAFGPAITVDAAVGRQVGAGLDRLAVYQAQGRLKHVRAVVVGLGTNGEFSSAQLARLAQLTAGVPRVVLVNVRAPVAWAPASDSTIDGASSHPGWVVADWYGASASPTLLYPDHIHPDPAGQVVYTNLVSRTVG